MSYEPRNCKICGSRVLMICDCPPKKIAEQISNKMINVAKKQLSQIEIKQQNMTFSKYWKSNKDMLTEHGVTELVAHKIWCDAIDAVQEEIVKEFKNQIKK